MLNNATALSTSAPLLIVTRPIPSARGLSDYAATVMIAYAQAAGLPNAAPRAVTNCPSARELRQRSGLTRGQWKRGLIELKALGILRHGKLFCGRWVTVLHNPARNSGQPAGIHA